MTPARSDRPLSPVERRLLDDYQQHLPDSPRPFAAMGEALGLDEDEVIAILARLTVEGFISRIGPVFRPHAIGASTLAAMTVPEERLLEVAVVVNGFEEVNHNYERDHRFNLWFVVTAPDESRVQAVLDAIRDRTGIPVMALPMLADYHIDLGFKLWA